MYKKLPFLMSLVLVIVLVGSASAVIEQTFTITPSIRGGTSTGTDPGYCDQGTLMYIGWKWGGSCNAGAGATDDITGWARFDVPDFSAMAVPQTITSAVIKIYVYGYNSPHPWAGLETTRVADDSWTAATINNSWAVSSDYIIDRPVGTETEGWSGTRYTDITSWFGAGKESLTGGEALSIRYKPIDLNGGANRMMLDFRSDGNALIITTVPEPMTIALLGFGGLALLRKRR